jgi:heat shock protein HslJ
MQMHWKTTAIIVALLSAPVLAQPNLIGTEWQLASPKVAEPLPTLSFQAKGISGFAGCNRFTGQAMPKASW